MAKILSVHYKSAASKAHIFSNEPIRAHTKAPRTLSLKHASVPPLLPWFVYWLLLVPLQRNWNHSPPLVVCKVKRWQKWVKEVHRDAKKGITAAASFIYSTLIGMTASPTAKRAIPGLYSKAQVDRCITVQTYSQLCWPRFIDTVFAKQNNSAKKHSETGL